VLVIDASVLVLVVGADGADGDRARERVRGERLAAPDLVDAEVLSVLRRGERAGLLIAGRAVLAIDDLLEIPLQRHGHRQLVRRCWELRANVTAYDATYVALAELLDATLLTADQRLARAPGTRCPVELLPALS
jgi:predicted nucleic acid-binding protein